MTFLRSLIAILLLATVQETVIAGSPGSAGAIWSGRSGGFAIDWRPADLNISAGGALVISFRALAAKEWMRLRHDAPGQALAFERSDAVLSAVGPYLSVQEGTFCDCGGAHPMEVERFRAIDLRDSRPDKPAPADLGQIFLPADIFDALMSDTVVQSALRSSAGELPHSLQDLVQALAFNAITKGGCSYFFGNDLLSNFAFHHLESGKVDIRLSLSHEAESCRGGLIQIGILLPIPEALRPALEAAQVKRAGLLMSDAVSLSKGASSVYRFSTAPTTGKRRP